MVKNIKFLKTGTGLFNMNICQKELTKEFTITTNLRDCYDNLKISSILDLTQEIASLHADILHVGFIVSTTFIDVPDFEMFPALSLTHI